MNVGSIRTENEAIKALVQAVVVAAKANFKERCVAVYMMGSLARGGFSELVSDIDIGIILQQPLGPGDADRVDSSRVAALTEVAAVNNSLSIFWGSVDSINRRAEGGRYPPFDRLDLIDHALLLEGKEVRSELIRPTKQELEIAGAAFALGYLGSEQRIREFLDVSLMAGKGDVYITKTVLFPARFIYLERTGKVAGNDVSYQYYLEHFQGDDAALVELAYQWRNESVPEPLDEIITPLERGLVPLYHRFIDSYVTAMNRYGEEALADQLLAWRQEIEAA